MTDKKIKRGQIGNLITLFFATIIIGLLLGTLIASNLVRSLDNSEAGVKVSKDAEVGLYDIEYYAVNYSNLVRARVIHLGYLNYENSIK